MGLGKKIIKNELVVDIMNKISDDCDNVTRKINNRLDEE